MMHSRNDIGEMIDATRAALIIQGLQNDVFDPSGALFSPALAEIMAGQRTLDNIARLAEAVRAGGGVVIYMNYVIEPDGAGQPATAPVFRNFVASGGVRRGTWGAQPFHGLPPQPGDLVLEKARVNPFYGSMLSPMLEGRGVTTVLPVGTQTHMGIVAASRYAADAGYRVVVASDATASDEVEKHRATVNYALVNVAELGATAEVVEQLRAARCLYGNHVVSSSHVV